DYTSFWRTAPKRPRASGSDARLCIGDREARADRHRGELIDRITADEPVRKLLFVEMFRNTRLPMTEYRPDYRARIKPNPVDPHPGGFGQTHQRHNSPAARTCAALTGGKCGLGESTASGSVAHLRQHAPTPRRQKNVRQGTNCQAKHGKAV